MNNKLAQAQAQLKPERVDKLVFLAENLLDVCVLVLVVDMLASD